MSCQNRRISRFWHRKVGVQNYVVKDLIVDILANFNAMLKSAIELLDVESHAREDGPNVDMDVQNGAPTLVGTVTS